MLIYFYSSISQKPRLVDHSKIVSEFEIINSDKIYLRVNDISRFYNEFKFYINFGISDKLHKDYPNLSKKDHEKKFISLNKFNSNPENYKYVSISSPFIDIDSLKIFTKVEELTLRGDVGDNVTFNFNQFLRLRHLIFSSSNPKLELKLNDEELHLRSLDLWLFSLNNLKNVSEIAVSNVKNFSLNLQAQKEVVFKPILKRFKSLLALSLTCISGYIDLEWLYSQNELEALVLKGNYYFESDSKLDLSRFTCLKYIILDGDYDSIDLDSINKCKMLNYVGITASNKKELLYIFSDLEKNETIACYGGGIKVGMNFKVVNKVLNAKMKKSGFHKYFIGTMTYRFNKEYSAGEVVSIHGDSLDEITTIL